MLRPKQPVRVAGRAGVGSAATANRIFPSPGWAAVSLSILARRFLSLLKLLRHAADYPIVQQSALIYGLMLALSAATMAGIGEWASGGFDSSIGGSESSPTAPDTSSSFPSPGGYAYNRNAMLPPLPAVVLPAVSNVSVSTTPGYTIRRTVPEVRLQFTIADEHGRLVQNLSPDDIRILDNQSPVLKFQDFARDDNLPLRLGVVLDVSDSVKRLLPEEKSAALGFLDHVLRPRDDRAFVLGVGGNVELWQDATNDHDRLTQAVNRVHQPGWGTVLYDALYSACVDRLHDDDGILVHRAIVVLSDGNDTDSLHTLSDAIAAAQKNEVQIYSLTVHKKGLRPAGDAVLQRLADETGGEFLVAQSAKEMQSAFADIDQQIHTQYYVSFPPQQSTPGFHALQVQVRSPQNAQVHARRGYYAMAQ